MTAVVLADDHAAFAEALASVLTDHGLDVRAVVHTTDDLVAAARRCRPDLCLLDRWFDDGDALAVLARLRGVAPASRFVVLTADADRAGPDVVLARGADGFVHKTRGVAALLDALDRVAAGATVVETPPRWASAPRAGTAPTRRPAAHLTVRERQCLALLVEGASTPDMAARLGVGVTTVRTHVQALMTKLGVHTRLEAAAHAVRCGLVAESSLPVERRA